MSWVLVILAFVVIFVAGFIRGTMPKDVPNYHNDHRFDP